MDIHLQLSSCSAFWSSYSMKSPSIKDSQLLSLLRLAEQLLSLLVLLINEISIIQWLLLRGICKGYGWIVTLKLKVHKIGIPFCSNYPLQVS